MRKYFLGIFILAIFLAIWSLLIEPGMVRYKDHDIYVNEWPKELNGFTIAFITDAHVGSPHISLQKMQEIVEKTNALKPDLILLGGDYMIQDVVGGRPVNSKLIAKTLGGLKAKHGVYGVLGNHDWWEDAPRMKKEMEDSGIIMLEDASALIEANGKKFWLVGVSDYTEGKHDIYKALTNVTPDIPTIILTHSPDIFPQIPNWVPLTLAGHTHGGQVYIPFIGRPVVPSKYGQRYAKGLIHEEGKQLFVGTGIGTSIFPIRFLTPPEVSILHINTPPEKEDEPEFKTAPEIKSWAAGAFGGGYTENYTFSRNEQLYNIVVAYRSFTSGVDSTEVTFFLQEDDGYYKIFEYPLTPAQLSVRQDENGFFINSGVQDKPLHHISYDDILKAR